MKKIHKPKGLIGINGKKPIGIADILPYLPNESGFVDTRHWIWGGVNEEFPFAVTTRINANQQQFLIEYDKQGEENNTDR